MDIDLCLETVLSFFGHHRHQLHQRESLDQFRHFINASDLPTDLLTPQH